MDPDEDEVVRSCTVELRPRREREAGARTYRYKPPRSLPVAVQRLGVILPVEEQQEVQQAERPAAEALEEESLQKPSSVK